MPSVTFDGRSFLLDSKRIWVVSGSIHMHRIPRAEWADRIHDAKLAGFNTIEVPVCWARHEQRPGVFDFEGENDLRHFIELIGKAGLWCILRPGPYLGEGWDLGGIPPWVLEIPKVQLRSNNGPFLEACSRYLGAVTDRVRSLQVTSTGTGGPILLVQNESGWYCSHEAVALGYLGELNRYLREGGITVPIINANNLWQNVEGEIDCWRGTEHMLAALRQLAYVRPDQPRIVIDFPTDDIQTVGSEDTTAQYIRGGVHTPLGPWSIQRRLAEITAGGGQFNVQPFAGGVTPGFWPGRLPHGPAVFAGRSNFRNGVITESGSHGPSYQAVRRIATFASRFWRVLSSLDQTYQPVTLDTTTPKAEAGRAANRGSRPAPDSSQVSVVHATGQQGGVVFVFAPDPAKTGQEPAGISTTLLLSDGSTLPVSLGKQAVAWCLVDAPLGGRAALDYCNLCALAVVGKVFVCFGPAGSKGQLSINGSGFEVTVPSGKSPLVEEHEGIWVVVCNEEQVDHVFVADDAVYANVRGITAEGRPLGLPGVKNAMRIGADGVVSNVPAEHPAPPVSEKIHVSAWTTAPMDDYVAGTSARFATIKGPSDLTSLGAPYGYGWYRVSLKSSSARKVRVAFPHAADRVAAYVDGQPAGVIGVGAGTTRHLTINLKKPATDVVFLAGNMGRFSEGDVMGERKGLYGHGWEVTPVKTGKPRIVTETPLDILSFRAPLWDVREGDTTIPERIVWTLQHRSKSSVILWLRDKQGRGFMGRGLLLLDGKPIELIEYGTPDQIVLDADSLSKGNHAISVALFPETLDEEFNGNIQAAMKALDDVVSFEEASEALTAKAEWSFAKWEQPPASAFHAPVRGAAGVPAWWRCTFDHAAGAPGVWLDLAGLTAGQVYINGFHLGRYFLRKGQSEKMLIPPSRLKAGKANDLLIFDEQGASPARAAHLSSDATGASGNARQ